MADREPPTLGRLKRLGVRRIQVVCRTCRKAAVLDVWEMIQTVGMGRRADSLRFRCRACGGRQTEMRLLGAEDVPM